MPDNDNQNDQTPGTGNDQTDYKSLYLDLSTKVTSDYVPKNVYTGLQTKHEKEVLAHKADFEALNAANQKAASLEATLQTVQGQVTEFQTKFTETETALKATKSKNERLGLIMEKFPALVQFEGKGLLPAADTLEDLEGKLTQFQELHAANAKQQRIERLSGQSDHPTGKEQLNQNPTADAILAEARALQRAGKHSEYNQKMNEYYKLQPQTA